MKDALQQGSQGMSVCGCNVQLTLKRGARRKQKKNYRPERQKWDDSCFHVHAARTKKTPKYVVVVVVVVVAVHHRYDAVHGHEKCPNEYWYVSISRTAETINAHPPGWDISHTHLTDVWWKKYIYCQLEPSQATASNSQVTTSKHRSPHYDI